MEIKADSEFEKAIKEVLITFINRYEAGKTLPEGEQVADGANAFNQAFLGIQAAIAALDGD